LPPLADDAFRSLFADDVGAAWRAFVDQYTPLLVALIERGGVRDRDEAMEVYTLVCERLVQRDCERLRRHDPSRGSLASWLAVVVRHVLVDWVRSRTGRRRLFRAIVEMDDVHQRVFELYFWEERSPVEIVEELAYLNVTLGDVFAALDAIHARLSDRHRSELLSSAVRGRAPISLDGEDERGPIDPIDDRLPVDEQLAQRQLTESFAAALAALPACDAAIVRLRYIEGLSLRAIQQALHLPRLTEAAVRDILDRLRDRLAALGVDVSRDVRAAASGQRNSS
jgi:DNA-directed RNA polymerase specialized sigma24 family protein